MYEFVDRGKAGSRKRHRDPGHRRREHGGRRQQSSLRVQKEVLHFTLVMESTPGNRPVIPPGRRGIGTDLLHDRASVMFGTENLSCHESLNSSLISDPPYLLQKLPGCCGERSSVDGDDGSWGSRDS